MNAIYLVEPHGRLLLTGLKTHILKGRYYKNFINKPLILVEDKKAFGIISLEEPDKIETERDFLKTFEKHRVSKEDAFKWWGRITDLFIYPVKVWFLFSKPVLIEVPHGVQTFFSISDKRILDKIPDWILKQS